MSDEPLSTILTTARELGFLGPRPIDVHIRHGRALARMLGGFDGTFLDLGSGAGLPGLVLLDAWPEARAVLVDAAQRRCRFLRRAVAELELGDRAVIVCGRAEELARDPELRDAHRLVVARSFGAPPVVAECGVGFVAPGGSLVVTQPPLPAGREPAAPAERWPATELAAFGLTLEAELRDDDAGAVVLRKEAPTPDRWPRRTGIPSKRPLW